MEKTVYVLITAAGSSSRMGGLKKELLKLNGKPLVVYCAESFFKTGKIASVYITCPLNMKDEFQDLFSSFFSDFPVTIIPGGATRQESVFNGLKAMKKSNPDYVLIHDGARPFVSRKIINAVIQGVIKHASCAPVVPVTDALKKVDQDNYIYDHPDRSDYKAIQTPQAFLYSDILHFHTKASETSLDYLDDTEIYSEFSGKKVFTVPGSQENVKITYREDLKSAGLMADREEGGKNSMRIGQGYDIHRLAEGRSLIIGGVTVPNHTGSDAHSDGDVLIHSIIDAVFGSISAGDIGAHFPPSDSEYKNISSRILLSKAGSILTSRGYKILNIDSTVILEKPRLRDFIDDMRKNIAEDLGIDPEAVSVKAKTKEKMDAAGAEKAIEAYSSILVSK